MNCGKSDDGLKRKKDVRNLLYAKSFSVCFIIVFANKLKLFESFRDG